MHPRMQLLQNITRRHFFKQSQAGIGALALASLMAQESSAAQDGLVNPLDAKKPHFKGKAKRVIYLHMTGSPPHLDLFDYKPELVKHQ